MNKSKNKMPISGLRVVYQETVDRLKKYDEMPEDLKTKSYFDEDKAKEAEKAIKKQKENE